MSKASAGGRGRSCVLRNYQHFNNLAGTEGEALQNEFATLTDNGLSPVCFHAFSIEDLVRDRLVPRPSRPDDALPASPIRSRIGVPRD